MTGVLTRIAIRYLAGYLVLKAFLPQDVADLIANDPDFAASIGLGLAAVVEGAYAFAKRRGWRT